MLSRQHYVLSRTSLFYAAFFIVMVVVILGGVYGVEKAGDINDRVNNIFAQELKPLETIEDIKASMYRIRERVGRYITEPERHEVHKAKIDEQLRRMERNKEDYQQTRLDDKEVRLIKKMDAAWQRYIDIVLAQVLPASLDGKQEQAEDVLYGAGLEAFREARHALNNLSDYQIQRAKERQYSANHAYKSILQIIFAIIIASLLLTIMLIIRYQQTQKAKKYSDSIIQNTGQAVMVTDKRLKIVSVNKAFEYITGYMEEEVRGHTPAILSSGRHAANFYSVMWQSIKEEGYWEGEIWNKHKDGNIYPEWLKITVFYGAEGQVEGYSGTFIDISKLKEAEEKARKLAYYDELTSLGNSHLLNERLGYVLEAAKINEYQVGLLLIDINHFKDINSSLGRHGGDCLLKEMAQLLERKVEHGDFVIRYDSDRFMVVLTASHSSFTRFSEQLVAFVDTLNKHTHLPIGDDSTIKVSWSVGVSSYPRHASEAKILIQQANIALFHNKRERPHSDYTFFESKFSEEVNHQYQLGLGVAKAIERDELFLVFQPQVSREGKVIGAEVLLRWDSKEFGFIPPDVFIPLAEESGDIVEIGRWVLDQTLSQIKKWQDSNLKNIECFKRIAINVSPHQIVSADIAQEFSEACQVSGVAQSCIELEVTETGLMKCSEDIVVKLQKLSDQGFSLAIDDFGTGYSSLGRLQHFPVDILKIDRSFTSKILENKTQAAIVEYIINMAHILNIEVVAEGVEKQAEVDMLMGFGCDIFQGYYFSKPLVADDFINYSLSN